MPQGVEHKASRSKIHCRTIEIPLMPQGVEHSQGESASCLPMRVRIPLMPQGVEHLAPVPSTLPAVMVLQTAP